MNFSLDALNRLVSAQNAGTDCTQKTANAENRVTGAAGYTYDADGNRVEKSNGSTGTLYWYMSPGIVV